MLATSVLALEFLAYSFLGWLLEGCVRCLMERRFVNPGFLTGPFVPIYGFGALGILALTQGVRTDPFLVFAGSILVATVVEFTGHLLLQRTLGLVLWDYSDRFGNIQGRVCMGNSVGFGLAGLAVVYGIQPPLAVALQALEPHLIVALASALTALLALDWSRSVAAVARLRPEIQSIQGSLARVRHRLETRLEDLGAEYDRRSARLLDRSRRVLTRLESAFPGARTVSADGLGGPMRESAWLIREDADSLPRVTGLKQPWLGIAATAVALAVGLLATVGWSFDTLTGVLADVMMCTIPFTVVVASFWHGREPRPLAALPQPWRGLSLLGLAAVVSGVVYLIESATIGGGRGATPFLAFGIILSVVVTFWLVVVFGGWPFSLLRNEVVAGVLVLVAVYVLAGLFVQLLDFGFLADQSFYPGMDPAGPVPAWDGLVGGVTCLATVFLFLHLDLWPLSRFPRLLRQPVLGVVWTPLILLVGVGAYLLGTRVLGLTPDAFLVAVPVPFMFGTVVLLTMLKGSVTARLHGAARGIVSSLLAFALGTALARLFLLLMPVLTPDVPQAGAAGQLNVHLWLASALLGVTFPLMAMYHDFFQLWPLAGRGQPPSRSRKASNSSELIA